MERKGQCPVCAGVLGDALVYCARCAAAHHAECWDYAGRCSVFGCGGDRNVANDPGSVVAGDVEIGPSPALSPEESVLLAGGPLEVVVPRSPGTLSALLAINLLLLFFGSPGAGQHAGGMGLLVVLFLVAALRWSPRGVRHVYDPSRRALLERRGGGDQPVESVYLDLAVYTQVRLRGRWYLKVPRIRDPEGPAAVDPDAACFWLSLVDPDRKHAVALRAPEGAGNAVRDVSYVMRPGLTFDHPFVPVPRRSLQPGPSITALARALAGRLSTPLAEVEEAERPDSLPGAPGAGRRVCIAVLAVLPLITYSMGLWAPGSGR